VSKKISFHLHVHGFDNIVQGLSNIQQTLEEGFERMSEAGDALTQAVTDVANKVDTLSCRSKKKFPRSSQPSVGLEQMLSYVRPWTVRFLGPRVWRTNWTP
jgi:hypothetical protein